jgi:RimJ/RimL family protein N-acetyltransferase
MYRDYRKALSAAAKEEYTRKRIRAALWTSRYSCPSKYADIMIVFNHADFGQRIAQAAYVSDYVPQRDPSITRVGKDGLVGGVVFQDYTGPHGSINIHCAGFSPRWLNRDFLYWVFSFTFDVLKVKKVIGKVHSGNLKALRLDHHLGFKVETVIEDVFPDADLIVLSMCRHECKWLSLPKPVVGVISGETRS